jgi:hypothetical protein
LNESKFNFFLLFPEFCYLNLFEIFQFFVLWLIITSIEMLKRVAPPAYDMASLEKVQRLLQDTTGVEDEEGETADDRVPPTTAMKKALQEAKCNDATGCGLLFPDDQPGSDFRFAQLCAACYKLRTTPPPTQGSDVGCNSVSTSESSTPPSSPLCSLSGDALPSLGKGGGSGGGSRGEEGEVEDSDVDTELLPPSLPPPLSSDGRASLDREHRGEEGEVEESDVDTESVVGQGEDDGSNIITEAEPAVEDTPPMAPGIAMGRILGNVYDNGLQRLNVEVGGNALVLVIVVNDQDNISPKSKKFFKLLVDSTPLLYGFVHAQALFDTRTRQGWIGHCRLTTSKEGAEGNGTVLWEVWETRCDKPRIDGIVISEEGVVTRVTYLQKWLIANELSCDVDHAFSEEFYNG